MRLRTFAALLAIALFAWPAAAQEQRGSIEGIVKDSSGAVLPGVTVTIAGGSGIKLDAVTDTQGQYRFPTLLPGVYTVTATLQGFGPSKIPNVQVNLGDQKKVDFALSIAGVSESVQVTAETPLIDVKQSQHSTDIRGEQIDLMPHGRDFTTLVTQAPGANNEPKSGGIMVDGSSAAENRYVVDGMETTDLVHGQSGKNVLADFVDEVQVKSSGYSAEYGGSTGAVINVLTKSGTNHYTGEGRFYFQGSSLAGAANQSLRLNPTNNAIAEYHTFPNDENKRYEPGGSLGGPILQNRAWFYGAYQPAMTTIDRTVNATTAGLATATNSSTEQKQQVQYLLADTTAQIGSKLRTRVAFNNSWSETKGLLASTGGGDKPNCADPANSGLVATGQCTSYTKGTKFPNYTVSGQADYTVSSKFFLSARIGRFLADDHDFNVPDVAQFSFSTPNIGMAGVPASEQHATPYTSVPSNSAVKYDTQTRDFFQADATYFAHLAGEHQIKGGVQIDHRGENINSGNLENIVNVHWGTTYQGVSGPFGYYELRSNAVSPRQGIITTGNVESKMNGFFVQDQWAVNNKLTVNGGIRTEDENVPAYTNAPGVAANPIKFGFGDKIAPRAGFSYDIKGDGSWKAYGSWGVFYDVFKLELPQGSFGGQKWISYFYTLDTPNFETVRDSASCPPACAGTQIGNSIDFRAVSVTPGVDVEQNLKPMQSREASVGLEHQIGGNKAVTARYINKYLARGIEDVGDLDPSGNEAYIIANPGEGQTAKFDISTGTSLYSPQGATNLTQTLPKPKRVYNAMELGFEKRYANNWFGKFTYTLSRDAGVYPGLSESDENGRSDPNVGREYDYPAEMFNGNGTPLNGPFETDRTHQVKMAGIYTFKWGMTVGANEYVASGTPVTPQVAIISGHSYPVDFLGRGGGGRLPMYSQLDMNVQQSVKIMKKDLIFELEVTNLFDQRNVINRAEAVQRQGALPLSPAYYNEAGFYAGTLNFPALIASAEANSATTGFISDPRYLMNSGYQTPISARVGVKFRF